MLGFPLYHAFKSALLAVCNRILLACISSQDSMHPREKGRAGLPRLELCHRIVVFGVFCLLSLL